MTPNYMREREVDRVKTLMQESTACIPFVAIGSDSAKAARYIVYRFVPLQPHAAEIRYRSRNAISSYSVTFF